MALDAYPHPSGDNGRGMHWVPTTHQSKSAVDRFVAEAQKMGVKWVTFLNDGATVGQNDYLDGSVQFFGTNGAQARFNLVQGTNIRDHNNDGYNNTIAPGKTFRFTVQQPFEYECTIHPGMKAKIVLAG